jgi:hypothetical protein
LSACLSVSKKEGTCTLTQSVSLPIITNIIILALPCLTFYIVEQSIYYHHSVRGLGGKWEAMKRGLDALTLSGNFTGRPRIQVKEIHADANPSFVDLVQDGSLARWRQNARDSHTPFFTFTLLREPISWALSAYFMMCIKQRICLPNNNNSERIPNATSLQDLQRLAQPNPQCTFLLRGGLPYHHRQQNWTPPVHSQCEGDLWQHFLQHMDWVGWLQHGTNSSTTMTLLDRILGFDIPLHSANVEQHEDKLGLQDIAHTPTELHLRKISALDSELYRRVQAFYTMDLWESLEDDLE